MAFYPTPEVIRAVTLQIHRCETLAELEEVGRGVRVAYAETGLDKVLHKAALDVWRDAYRRQRALLERRAGGSVDRSR